MFTSNVETKEDSTKIMFNSRHCERRPLNKPGDGNCRSIPKHINFNIILKLGLYFRFFF